ncbi:MAG: hypothetical protein H0T53_16215 [Herpetosiphonaceae bacterium]|nr:hypothetical protein [Herpetosiphonaceae bacterium]
MDKVGIDWTLLLFQIGNLLILIAYVTLVVIALRRLLRTHKPLMVYLLWLLIILVVPFAGAALFLLEHPAAVARRTS